MITDTLDKIKEQQWFQQAQNSYEQLSQEQQSYVKWGSLAAGVGLLLYLTFSTIQSANSVKNEYFEKQELSHLITNANDEIKRLKGKNAEFSQITTQSWKAAIQAMATAQGINPQAIEIVQEAPGPAQDVIQETLLQIQIKGIPLRPLIQVLYQMEHGSPPMKLKGMIIESGTTDAVLDAKLNLSGYMAKPDKGEKTK